MDEVERPADAPRRDHARRTDAPLRRLSPKDHSDALSARAGRAPLLAMAAAVTIWAMHFAAVYAISSAACGPRALLDPGGLKLLVAGATAAALVLIAVVAWLGAVRESPRSLTIALRTTVAVAAGTVAVETLPAVFFDGCR